MGKSLLYILDKISLEREGLQPPKHHLSSFALRIPAGHLQEGMQSGWMVHRMSENVSRVRVSLNSLASHSVCVVQLLAALRSLLEENRSWGVDGSPLGLNDQFLIRKADSATCHTHDL